MLWMAKPTQYVDDTAFVLKFSLVIAGIFLTRSFSMTIQRESAAWEVKSAVSSRGVQLATAALLLWCVVLIAGRLTAHLGAI
jgi:hypothetical protein